MIRYKNKRAFSLPELLITIVIVSILVTMVAARIQKLKSKVIATEAITNLGSIRLAERAYYSQHGKYTDDLRDLYFKLRWDTPQAYSELDGTYFGEESYRYRSMEVSPDGKSFLVYCVPYFALFGNAPKKTEAWSVVGNFKIDGYIAMDQDGKLYSNIPRLGYDRSPND